MSKDKENIIINTNTGSKIKAEKHLGQLSVDIFHTPKEIVIIAPIAGTKSKDVHLSITKDTLNIRGKRDISARVNEADYYTKECFWGEFARSIVLPLEADTGKISATFSDCILEVRIPKSSKKTQIIKIKNS